MTAPTMGLRPLTTAETKDAVNLANLDLLAALRKLDEREPHAFDEVLDAISAFGMAQWTAGYVLGHREGQL